jgi:hypothetical protein
LHGGSNVSLESSVGMPSTFASNNCCLMLR